MRDESSIELQIPRRPVKLVLFLLLFMGTTGALGWYAWKLREETKAATESQGEADKRVNMLPLSDSLNMGEYERLQLEFARTGGTRREALANAIYNDAERLTRHMQYRMEQAIGDVLTDARDGRELMLHALDADGRDGGALQRGQEHPPEAVAEGVAEAAVERLDLEAAEGLAGRLVGHAGGLGVQHVWLLLSGAGPERRGCRAGHRLPARASRTRAIAVGPLTVTSSSTPR